MIVPTEILISNPPRNCQTTARNPYSNRKSYSWDEYFTNLIRGKFSRQEMKQLTLMSCSSISPKQFWNVQIVLDRYKLFWLGPNHFGQVKIGLFWTNSYNLDLSKMVWIQTKRIGPVQNDCFSTKMIGPIEGKGINIISHKNE